MIFNTFVTSDYRIIANYYKKKKPNLITQVGLFYILKVNYSALGVILFSSLGGLGKSAFL